MLRFSRLFAFLFCHIPYRHAHGIIDLSADPNATPPPSGSPFSSPGQTQTHTAVGGTSPFGAEGAWLSSDFLVVVRKGRGCWCLGTATGVVSPLRRWVASAWSWPSCVETR
ncbi:hypothetical protein K438DRAFT_1866762 [Mycena galopus ATCC 62051]|nr:hypothetical protein K438DRAFT_1866762 [Mycena galopus ATCC 62051]